MRRSTVQRFRTFISKAALVGALVLWVAGCAGGPAPSGPSIAETPIPPDPAYAAADAYRTEGSLWRENSSFSNLFSNPKARRIGDIVTVRIVESSKASNQASTKTGRTSSISAGIDNLFNLEAGFPKRSNLEFNPFARVKGDITSDFDGSGTTTRSGDLTAYITARIVGVLAGGNLKIAGTREVMVNGERQWISLAGIIRPRDISPENVILSTYISDARIAYSGAGVIDERQRPGWLTRILDKVWPF